MALGQEALTRSGRPRSQNSSSRHAKPPFATQVARFVPVLDSSVEITGLTIADFRNILAFSEPSTVYTAPMQILNRTPMTGIAFFQPGGPNEVSANVPSMLFEDMTLTTPTGDVPILRSGTHPYFDK